MKELIKIIVRLLSPRYVARLYFYDLDAGQLVPRLVTTSPVGSHRTAFNHCADLAPFNKAEWVTLPGTTNQFIVPTVAFTYWKIVMEAV